MAPQASPTILTVLGAALSTAARIALSEGSLTGPAGAGGMSAKTSGNPKRLKNWRTSASRDGGRGRTSSIFRMMAEPRISRSEEHTSELQSRGHLVCRLLLEKKKNK